MNNNNGVAIGGNVVANNIITKDLLNLVYPIGRGFIDFTDTDYSNYLGFKWERELIGMTPIGYNQNDSDFNKIGKTGGSKTHTHSQGSTGSWSGTTGSHTLTIAEMPSHRHAIYSGFEVEGYSGTNDAYNYGTKNCGGVDYKDDDSYRSLAKTGGGQGHTHSLPSHSHTNPNTNSSSSLSPYKVVAYWKRVS